jgi:hypothetical protein
MAFKRKKERKKGRKKERKEERKKREMHLGNYRESNLSV